MKEKTIYQHTDILMQSKYDVFISYSRKDYVDDARRVIPGNVLTRIKQVLAENDISYWFDEEGIYSGQEFTSVITKAIRTSRVFVFVSSENSNASLWTSNEIAIAKRLDKPIIPFSIDDSPYNDSVMMLIAALDYIDGRDQETAYQKLVRAIQYYIFGMSSMPDTESREKIQQCETRKEECAHPDIQWYERLANPSFSRFQKLLVYVQLCLYSLLLFFVVWTSLFGALAVYHHFQVSQLMLMLTLGISLFSTTMLRTGKIVWWAIICVCDILAVFYVSVLAKYLYVNWSSFSSLDMPLSMRYRWLYVIGKEMEQGDHFFVHPTLMIFALSHVIMICLSFFRGGGQRDRICSRE